MIGGLLERNPRFANWLYGFTPPESGTVVLVHRRVYIVPARLDPQLVLGVIEVESAFRKYAVSRAGARGYMQVMPFWINLIGQPGHNLFHLRTNLAYGCAILRHYLDLENGDYFRALGRYNGSLGQPQYPNLVLAAWRGRWKYDGPTA